MNHSTQGCDLISSGPDSHCCWEQIWAEVIFVFVTLELVAPLCPLLFTFQTCIASQLFWWGYMAAFTLTATGTDWWLLHVCITKTLFCHQIWAICEFYFKICILTFLSCLKKFGSVHVALQCSPMIYFIFFVCRLL